MRDPKKTADLEQTGKLGLKRSSKAKHHLVMTSSHHLRLSTGGAPAVLQLCQDIGLPQSAVFVRGNEGGDYKACSSLFNEPSNGLLSLDTGM